MISHCSDRELEHKTSESYYWFILRSLRTHIFDLKFHVFTLQAASHDWQKVELFSNYIATGYTTTAFACIPQYLHNCYFDTPTSIGKQNVLDSMGLCDHFFNLSYLSTCYSTYL